MLRFGASHGYLMKDLGVEMKFSSLASAVVRGIAPAALMVLLSCPPDALGQTVREDHLVSSNMLQQQLADSAAARRKNVETITNFLNTPAAEQAMREAHFDSVQVRTAIPSLSDQELATLAARSTDAQQKFAAGRLTRPELAIVVIALVVLIVVIIVH